MAVPRLVARTLIQRRLRYAVSIRQITTPPPPPPPNPTSTDEPLKPKSLPSLDISPIEATPPPNTPSGKPTGERTGARSAKDSLSTIEKKRQTFARWTIAFGLAGVIGGAVYMGREWESEEEKKAIGAGVSRPLIYPILSPIIFAGGIVIIRSIQSTNNRHVQRESNGIL
jgi:hypothetical protein